MAAWPETAACTGLTGAAAGGPCGAAYRAVAGQVGVELFQARFVAEAFEPHTHQAYGLGVIESGVERFRYRGTEHLAAPQSIILLDPDVLHTGRAETEAGWGYRMLYVAPPLLAAMTGQAPWSFGEPVCTRQPALAWALSTLHRRLWRCDDPLEAAGLLGELFDGLRPVARTQAAPQDGARAGFERVIDYMRSAMGERLVLDDLAAVAGLSPFHFLRKFKAQHHVTPHQMLMALRLCEAKRLLARRLPPAAVAATVGLTDQAHLTRAFARRYGVTPARYQRQLG